MWRLPDSGTVSGFRPPPEWALLHGVNARSGGFLLTPIRGCEALVLRALRPLSLVLGAAFFGGAPALLASVSGGEIVKIILIVYNIFTNRCGGESRRLSGLD